MGNLKFFHDLVEGKLLALHTSFLAKILNTDGKVAKIQPLQMIKQYGKEAEQYAPLEDVPILQSVKKFETEPLKCGCKDCELEGDLVILKDVKKGDVVLCICCERNITEAVKGEVTTSVIGHHEMHDAVIVGVL